MTNPIIDTDLMSLSRQIMGGTVCKDWRPHERWDHMGLLVDAMREQGMHIYINIGRDGTSAVIFPSPTLTSARFEERADNAPESLTRTALAMLEKE